MADFPEYDEAKWLENSLQEIHAAWESIREKASTGEKAWLTQLKNHYVKMAKEDPEAVAEKLAVHEYVSRIVEKTKKKSA